MKEWKIRQELYHRLNPEYEDDLKKFQIEIQSNIIDNAVKYFKETDVGWIYPAKSYMVAICYSKWLSEIFGEKYLDYLNDDGLLHYNDPYYIPYYKDSVTYDEILKKIGHWNFKNEGIVPDVRYYFEKEFMINENENVLL
jgi:hypothetical protein